MITEELIGELADAVFDAGRNLVVRNNKDCQEQNIADVLSHCNNREELDGIKTYCKAIAYELKRIADHFCGEE